LLIFHLPSSIRSPIFDAMIGSVAIPAGVAEFTLSGLRLGLTVKRVVCSVRKPSGAPTIGASTVAESLSADGFGVCLSGITPSSGYVLDFFAGLEEMVILPTGRAFDAWLDGAPVLVPADEQTFWSWLDEAPVIDQS
jgi:hypothetical protein